MKENEIKIIKELREKTKASISECKKALSETNYNIDEAIKYLRRLDINFTNKKSSNDNNEGIVLASVNKKCNFGVIISLLTETDFVAKNDTIKDFVEKVSNIATEKEIETIEELKKQKYDDKFDTVNDKFLNLQSQFKENLVLKIFSLCGETIGLYNHYNNKLCVIVSVKNCKKYDILKDIAMQIAAMNPLAIRKEDVSSEIIDEETEKAKEKAVNAKNDHIACKIIEGQLENFFKKNILLEQSFTKDERISVYDYIKENDKDLIIVEFKRIIIGV